MKAPLLLLSSEFAKLIRWHPESVRRAIRAGRIHAIKAGKDWRIPCKEAQNIIVNGLPAAARNQTTMKPK